MPPKRCPECGRFLSNEFVASLVDARVACPRCDTMLGADALVGGAGSPGRPRRRQAAEVQGMIATAVDPAGGDTTGDTPSDTPDDGDAVPSIRPPDLDPSEVRAPGDDVLAGWDVGVTPDEVDSWRADHRPFPTDAVVVAGAALLGGVLGAALCDRHRGLGAAVGVLGGGIAAGAARRVWELTG